MATPKKAESKKGRPMDVSGVPGELVSLEGLALEFGAGQRKKSPYDPLLDQLIAAGPGKALRFGDLKARTSVTSRAKKKGLRISFAELAGALYVRLDGRVDDDVKASRRAKILQTLKPGTPMSAIQLAVRLRDGGDQAADGQIVAAILGQMVKAGDVIQREGETFACNTRKAA